MTWLATADESGAQAFTDPSLWLNAGALGLIAGLFVFGYLHSTRELDRVEEHAARTVADLIRTHESTMANMIRTHEETVRNMKDAHAAAMERQDDLVRALSVRAENSEAERNKAVDVMKDFTLMAGTILNNQQWPPRRPGAGRD